MANAQDVTVDTHSLLLSLAGTLDDELLVWCRELVAVGEADYAVELVTAAVQADRVKLGPAAHAQLSDAADRRHVLGRDETLPPADPSARMRHRFVADPAAGGFPVPAPEAAPERALTTVPPRLLRNCQLWLTWRATPAGAAPGPLPHPVVLIETDELDGADVLAYQVGEVLRQAGVFASVEVFAAGGELGEYHRAAMEAAHRVDAQGGEVRPANGAARAPGRPSPGPTNGVPSANGAPTPNGVGANGVGNGVEAPRPTPNGSGSGSLRPVDRVIAAREAAPRRPGIEGSDGFDGVGSNLNFERSGSGDAAGPAAERRPGPPRPAPPPSAGERRTPPGGGSGKLLPGRPDTSGAPLSENEQRLLRQLNQELAAREDPDAPPDGPAVYGDGGSAPRPS